MISHAHRALFVHIPKCGGQSIEHFFLRAQGLDWNQRDRLCLRPNRDPTRGPPRLAHMTAEEYLRLGYLAPAEFGRYFKFAFVRNPWARLVSEYRYRPFYVHRYDFRTFVLRKLPSPGWSDLYRHVMPQRRYLVDGQGRMLVDYVGRLETLQADFGHVCAKLGLDDAELPRVNVTKVAADGLFSRTTWYRIEGALGGRFRVPEWKDYRDYYDSETRDYVAELYREDIEAFGYAFDPPEEAGRHVPAVAAPAPRPAQAAPGPVGR